MNKQEALRSLIAITNALLETVQEVGEVPAGVMYAACMEKGMSLELFELIMGGLVTAGRVTKRNQCYYPV